MDPELPKRFFREKEEPEVVKINNSCRLSILELVEKVLPNEYNTVKADPVFSHIIALYTNELGYSGKLIHSMMCKQIDTTKLHELWFVFARKPLRFSLQEFYAVTRLKYKTDQITNFEEYVADNGFWSEVLKHTHNISLLHIKDEHIHNAKKWKRVDRLRLVYFASLLGF